MMVFCGRSIREQFQCLLRKKSGFRRLNMGASSYEICSTQSIKIKLPKLPEVDCESAQFEWQQRHSNATSTRGAPFVRKAVAAAACVALSYALMVCSGAILDECSAIFVRKAMTAAFTSTPPRSELPMRERKQLD